MSIEKLNNQLFFEYLHKNQFKKIFNNNETLLTYALTTYSLKNNQFVDKLFLTSSEWDKLLKNSDLNHPISLPPPNEKIKKILDLVLLKNKTFGYNLSTKKITYIIKNSTIDKNNHSLSLAIQNNHYENYNLTKETWDYFIKTSNINQNLPLLDYLKKRSVYTPINLSNNSLEYLIKNSDLTKTDQLGVTPLMLLIENSYDLNFPEKITTYIIRNSNINQLNKQNQNAFDYLISSINKPNKISEKDLLYIVDKTLDNKQSKDFTKEFLIFIKKTYSSSYVKQKWADPVIENLIKNINLNEDSLKLIKDFIPTISSEILLYSLTTKQVKMFFEKTFPQLPKNLKENFLFYSLHFFKSEESSIKIFNIISSISKDFLLPYKKNFLNLYRTLGENKLLENFIKKLEIPIQEWPWEHKNDTNLMDFLENLKVNMSFEKIHKSIKNKNNPDKTTKVKI
jgi:hypothetical protein